MKQPCKVAVQCWPNTCRVHHFQQSPTQKEQRTVLKKDLSLSCGSLRNQGVHQNELFKDIKQLTVFWLFVEISQTKQKQKYIIMLKFSKFGSKSDLDPNPIKHKQGRRCHMSILNISELIKLSFHKKLISVRTP